MGAAAGVGAEALAVYAQTGDLHYGAGSARVSVPGMSQARAIKLETDILGANNRVAQQNRAHFDAHGVTALNLVSSPGSGKTTLLCATIEALKQHAPGLHVAVIEGDQQTSFDADRIRATGAPAIQVNTGKGCHLDAQMVGDAFGRLDLHAAVHGQGAASRDLGGALLFIENVGNLVCPAMWDLGEAGKIIDMIVNQSTFFFYVSSKTEIYTASPRSTSAGKPSSVCPACTLVAPAGMVALPATGSQVEPPSVETSSAGSAPVSVPTAAVPDTSAGVNTTGAVLGFESVTV